MTRMIKAKRLASLLGPLGFALSADFGESEILYSRPAQIDDLWEIIVVNVGGRRGEAVGTDVGASVCYSGVGARGLDERRFVEETGTPFRPPPEPHGGTRFLAGPDDAASWEQLVVEVCPNKARAFAHEVGPALLARTAEARAAVNRYLEFFGTRDWRELRSRLEPRATSRELRDANRIATTPPTIQVFNGREFYETIVLGIMLYSDRVEGRQIAPPGVEVWPAFDQSSKKEPDWSKWQLAWRIEILADRMLARYPETMPSSLPE